MRTIEDQQRACAVTEVLEAWECRGVKYAALHGLEEFPKTIGRDIDCLFEAPHEAAALKTAAQVLGNSGWSLAHPPPIWGERIVAFHAGNWSSGLEFHSVKRVAWRSATLASSPYPVYNPKGFYTDPWASFAKRVILPLVSQGSSAFPKIFSEKVFEGEDKEFICKQLEHLLGRVAMLDFLYALQIKDLRRTQALIPSLRRSISMQAWSQAPLVSFLTGIRQVLRSIRFRFHPCSPVVALVGPDGVGKSTLLQLLSSGDKSIFTKIVIRHWRPGILPPLGDLFRFISKRERGGACAPRRKSGRFGIVRAMYYLLDFWIGDVLLDRRDSARQRLVVYDRCALDMAVDPVRYGIGSAWLGRLVAKLAPRPDLVIALAGDSQTIHERKPELPVSELDRQLQCWADFAKTGRVDVICSIDQSPEALVDEIRSSIVVAFLRKNRHAEPL